MKKLLLILSLALLGCSLPFQLDLGTSTSTPTPTSSPTPALTQTPLAPPELGSELNPLIIALAPSARPGAELVAAGTIIAAVIEERTGYKVVTSAPSTQIDLVDALDKGNAHIASLSPYAYLLARENDSISAVLASIRNGEMCYGAQFIANRESDFLSYYDSARDDNTADAAEALEQFQDKKPCWTDSTSPSGFVVPLGLLNQARVQIRSAAVLEGQPSVVRAVYAESICDFGATFVDARESASLEAKYPDVMEKVVVIWRVPKVIPYENISVSNLVPIEMRRVIQRAFIDLMLTPEGKSAIQTVYGMDEIQIADDLMYEDFSFYVRESGLSLTDLIK